MPTATCLHLVELRETGRQNEARRRGERHEAGLRNDELDAARLDLGEDPLDFEHAEAADGRDRRCHWSGGGQVDRRCDLVTGS